MMAAWLEGDVRSCASEISIACRSNGIHLGVRTAESFVPAGCDPLSFPGQHAAHHWIGLNTSLPARSEFQRVMHAGEVEVTPGHAG